MIPVYNRPDFLERCLASLARQDFPVEEFEILICDDGSTEDLQPIVEKFSAHFSHIRLLRQEPCKGPAAARNLGIRSSKASIIVCLDSDVICERSFLRRVLGALKAHSDWVAAEAAVLPIDGEDSPLWDAPVNKGGSFLTAACAYRAEALRRVGGFDENFPFAACEDVDLAARLLRLGQFGYVQEAIAYHPRRRVNLHTRWKWRRDWKYVMILAKRYGFLGFPGKSAGRFPRLRVALSAVVTLPAGRFIEGIRYLRQKRMGVGVLACLYAIFDVVCGLCALSGILLGRVPKLKNYLQTNDEHPRF